jgi:alpha-1,2-mannosyltransferase
MLIAKVIAYAIFGGYFALIAGAFTLVFMSIGAQKSSDALLQTRPFAFLRVAFGALLCTWYCELCDRCELCKSR